MEPDEMKLIEIIERMPDNLTDMEKVRYIYIEVCRFFVYNTEYITGDDNEKVKLFAEDVDLNNVTNNKAICSKLSRAIAYLLEACGIDCNCIYFNGGQEGHMEAVCRVDEKLYELDAARDLMNVKMGYQTRGFAFPMKSNASEDFINYSYLSEDEVKKLDDAIGYTFGLSDEYVDKVVARGESKEDHDFRIYMDEAIDEIGDALNDYKLFKEYLESVHPEVNVDLLSAHGYDKYRIEFIVNYMNSYAKDYSYIDRRDFFESLIARALDIRDDALKLFNGTDNSGELFTILKYEGVIADNDLFYLVRDGQDIKQLSVKEVKAILDDGFKTISKGKEKFIIRKDNTFKRISYDYAQEINMYLAAVEDEAEMEERESEVFAVLSLQKLRSAIAEYEEKIYSFVKAMNIFSDSQIKDAIKGKGLQGLKPEHTASLVSQIHDSFIREVNKYGYAGFFNNEDLDINNPKSLSNLYANMKKLEEILEEQAGIVLEIIEEYKQALKMEAVARDMKLYHVSTLSPDEMDGKLRPHFAKSQFNQEFGEILCGSTESVDSNPYILARVNGKGMYRLPIGQNSYLLNGDNISIEKDENGNSRAISKVPGYIYYMPIDNFEPSILLKCDEDEYFLEFDQEWTTDQEIEIPKEVAKNVKKRGEVSIISNQDDDSSKVYGIEKYTDVTSILEHNQIAINVDLNPSDMLSLSTRKSVNNVSIKSIILDLIQSGKIRYLNGEAGVNAHRDARIAIDKPTIRYDGEKIINGPKVISPDEVKKQQIRLRDFVKHAINSGIKYGDYVEIMKMQELHDKTKSDTNIDQFNQEL